jgi:hypothetical protein
MFNMTGQLMTATYPEDKPFHMVFRLPDAEGCFYLRINNKVSRLFIVE